MKTLQIIKRASIFAILALNFLALHHASADSFTNTGSMITGRYWGAAALLPNGKVLVAGGYNSSSTYLSSAELYNPATGTWTATAPMNYARNNYTATLLPNGKVLVAGGYNSVNVYLSSAELYDPATETWTPTGSLNTGRDFHTATLLPNGKVLVVGGETFGISDVSSAELYDPASGTWTVTGALNVARQRHTETLLANGNVLVTGGSVVTGGYLNSSELYNPATGIWTMTGTMNTAPAFHTATLLANGKVLVAGGFSTNSYLSSAELYDPAAGTWTLTSSMSTARAYHTATLLPNGKVLAAGGQAYWPPGDVSSVELFDPAAGTWTLTGSMNNARNHQTATLLPNGQVLIAGGVNGSTVLSGAELYGNTLNQKPLIYLQPQSQAAPNGSNVTFSVVASGFPAPNYQWLFNGQPMPTATNSTLTVTVNALTTLDGGGYSVVVWNAYGTNTSATATLKLLGIDTSLNTFLLTAGPLPARQAGKNNLVVVTHGAQPSNPDVTWITNLCNSISNQLAIRGSNDWQVIPYAWVSQAGLSANVPADVWSVISSLKLATLFETPLANAKNLGTQIGRQIAAQGWSHVHLIAHSAGAGLIQAAADAIRANAPNTVIQTTFLDPFLGADHRGLSEYGANANWSDNYFDHDQLTGSYTEGSLVHAYNVDVTWTDPAASVTPVYAPGNEGSLNQFSQQIVGYTAFSSHDWPHNFYQETVSGTETNCAVGYGFPLSMEVGGGNNLLIYPEGSSPQEPCGTTPISQNPFAINTGSQLQIGILPNSMSSLGAALSGSSGINLSSTSLQITPLGKFKPLDENSTSSTNSPAWFAVGLTITNFVNFVQFDSEFTDSNNAEGLLTVYWDTNQIGTVDERVVSPGLQTYRFYLPNTVTNNVYVLGFRLDSFDNTSSSIMVTNVATGFIGITTPLTLGLTLTNSTPLLQLTGASNYNYLVQTSTNLVDWTPTALLVNSNGTVLFPDSSAANSSTRFYRAIMP